MKSEKSAALALSAALTLALAWIPGLAAAQMMGMKVLSEKSVTGFPFPESVGCDPAHKVLYVSQFVSALKPTEKDGMGRISKVAPNGQIVEAQFLPPKGVILNKPKGIWVKGNRLWVTDIDVVWEFDLNTRRGRKVALPGVKFANDPAVMGNALYVSDNRGDILFKVAPADFLNMKGEPKVSQVFSGRGVNPNGLYPSRSGMLLMVGFAAKDQPRGITALYKGSEIVNLSPAIGMLDGLYEMKDRSLLATDWVSGSLFHWSADGGVQKLATGFKGPADLCVMPGRDGLTVIVPDLVKSELRFVELGK